MGDLLEEPICEICNNRHSVIADCPPWTRPADTRPTNCRDRLQDEGKDHPKSGCDVAGCNGVFGSLCKGEGLASEHAPSGTGSHMTLGIVYRCVDCHHYHVPNTPCPEASDRGETLWHFEVSCLGRTMGYVIGLDDDVPRREHYHTELIKRTIIEAHVRITKGLGMSQAARLAADEIITLFDPTHKRLEPFCNCPTGIAADAYDPGGPMSGLPRPLCLLHNPDPKGRR